MADYITKEGMQRLNQRSAELIQLRAKVIKQVVEAREMGDLSENAEYHAAKDEQAHIEDKILKLGIQHSVVSDTLCYDVNDSLISCEDEKFSSNNTYKIIYGLTEDKFNISNVGVFYKNHLLKDFQLDKAYEFYQMMKGEPIQEILPFYLD